jgi:hypothetical protein
MEKPVNLPLHYHLLVTGRLDRLWADSLYEAEIRDASTPGGATLTELNGDVPDHAALLGILNMVHDLGLTIRHMDVEPVV